MSVAYFSRWKFNLTLSIEILVYKTAVGAVKSEMGLSDLVGDS
jgi:hypothetical protein